MVNHEKIFKFRQKRGQLIITQKNNKNWTKNNK
jgi:hypothetical protein